MMQMIFQTDVPVYKIETIKGMEKDVAAFNARKDGYVYYLNMRVDRTFICFRFPERTFKGWLRRTFK